jgi:exopolysaccharide biosynthesis polyprenyl glycosylphosphotransferase
VYLERKRTLRGLYAGLDAACIAAAFALALALRAAHVQLPWLAQWKAMDWRTGQAVDTDYALLLLLSLATWIWALRRGDRWRVTHHGGALRLLLHHLRGLGWAVLATGAPVFLLKLGAVSRLFFAYFFAGGFVLLLAKDVVVRLLFERLRQSEKWAREALVIGSGQPASWFVQAMLAQGAPGYETVSVVVPDDGELPASLGGAQVLGRVADLDRVLVDRPVQEVFVVGSAVQLAQLAPVAQRLIERGRVVSLVSALAGGTHGVRGRVTEFAGIPMIAFGPMPRDPVSAAGKRILDVVGAAGLLAVFAPVMVGVAVLIKWLDPGPTVFSQNRLGRGGKPFRIYKFRSMRKDAEEVLRRDPALHARYVANDFKLPEHEDPRISPLGRILRKTSLDELPQLWNVLKGDMSLVGPRPIVPAEIDNYQPYADLFLTVRPGLTGFWQVSGRSAVSYPERAFLDLDYIANHSLAVDVSILLLTVPAVLARKGAH